MNKNISIALLVVAIIVVAFGANAYYSTTSDISRLFMGIPTEKARWLLIGGLSAGLVGFLGLFRR